jgi:predicted transcriptional regulator
MGQVTIYLDDEIESKMRESAEAMKLSKSKWIADLIKEKVTDEWPESVRKLAGTWKDFPLAEKNNW